MLYYFGILTQHVMTHNELNEMIEDAWRQLAEAASRREWPATQSAFRRTAALQDLHQQSLNLQEKIAALSGEKPTASVRGNGFQNPIVPVSPAYGRKRGTNRPKELRIGTHRMPIAVSNQIVIETANWILRQGHELPLIQNFVHPTNAHFLPSAQTRQLDNGSFIEIGDSQETLLLKARKLLNACNFADLKLEVVLQDGTVKTA
jgi:hypothetical protein